jgi:hypothetical protein
MKNPLVKAVRCAFGGLAMICAHAHAFDLTVQAGYGAEYTNNTAQTANNEVGEWIQTPQMTVSAAEEGPSLSALANYNVSRQIHQKDTFNDQTNPVGSGQLTWRAIADRLTFDLSSASTLSTINSQASNVQTNQQVVNTTTAGATLTVPGFSNHLIDLRYAASLYNANSTNTDSQTQTGTASYIVPLSTKDRIQLNASVGDTKYNSSQSPDYISQSGNLQYVRGGDWIELDTQVGYTVFDQQQGAKNVSGTTGDVKLTWHASEATTVNASYTRSLQSQSQNITTGIPSFGQTVTDNTNTTTPYTLDATSLGLSTKLGPNTIDQRGYIEDQKYENGTLTSPATQPDQNTKGVKLVLGRALRPTLRGRIFVNYSKVDYKGSSNQDNYDAGLRLDWTRWRNLTVSAGTEYSKRTSDVASQEYNEWMGTISLMYMLVGKGR